MKKFIIIAFMLSLFASTNIYASCSDAYIAKMIKRGLSDSAISNACDEPKKEAKEDKKDNINVIVNVENKPTNNNVNTNTNTNTGSSSVANYQLVDTTDYFFWRIGWASMSMDDYSISPTGISFGLQWYPKGLKEDGWGVGYSIFGGSETKQTTCDYSYYSGYTTTTYDCDKDYHETVAAWELLYNFRLDSGYVLTPFFGLGSQHSSVEYSNSNTADGDSSISEIGVYWTFPQVVRNGQGVSLFFKQASLDRNPDGREGSTTTFGIDWIW